MRQRGFKGASRRTLSCGVAVEAENHRLGETEQLAHMLIGACGTQRGHRIVEPRLRKGHDVHVAFDDQCVAARAHAASRLEQSVQLATLDKQRCLGRIEVLGLAAIEYAATKADRLSLHRTDREHDAVAKAVIALLMRIGFAVHDNQARLDQQRVVVLREGAGQWPPALGRIANAEA